MATRLGYEIIGDDYRVDPTLDKGFGYSGPGERPKCAQPATIKAMSTSDLLDLIAEKTAKKLWLTDLCDAKGLPVKNQTQSSFCHVHAPTHAMEIEYLKQGGDLKILSAFYAGAHITNGRDIGGSGITDVQFLHDYGTCLESLHPPLPDRNAFHVDNDPAHVANAKLHRIVGWEELDPSDNMLIYTAVALDQPVTVGVPSWGHEILLTALTVVNGKILPIFDNSWGAGWSQNGRGILSGNKLRFDEAGSIRTCTPSSN